MSVADLYVLRARINKLLSRVSISIHADMIISAFGFISLILLSFDVSCQTGWVRVCSGYLKYGQLFVNFWWVAVV